MSGEPSPRTDRSTTGRPVESLPAKKVGRFPPPTGYDDETRLLPILTWLDDRERHCGPQLYRMTAWWGTGQFKGALYYSAGLRDGILAYPEASELVIEWLGNA